MCCNVMLRDAPSPQTYIYLAVYVKCLWTLFLYLSQLEGHSINSKRANLYQQFLRCIRQMTAPYSAEVCPIWQW